MFTILGSTGFVGSHLKIYLECIGKEVFCPPRNFIPDKSKNYGNIIYCIGLTSDFRERPYETIEAHVCLLNKLIKEVNFESLIYLSSTRVYQHSNNTEESAFINVNPNINGDLYNISKLMGESICLNNSNRNTKIVRLSNIIGDDFDSNNFFYSLLDQALNQHQIILGQDLDSSKDYIHITEVVSLIHEIAIKGKEKIYNIASGYNISNKELITAINKHIDFKLSFKQPVINQVFNDINIDKIKHEFGSNSEPILRILDKLIIKRLEQK